MHVSTHWFDEDYRQKDKITKKKREKETIQKPTKQNYFSDLQVLDSLGQKQENWKKYRQPCSVEPLSSVLPQLRVSVCHPPQAGSAPGRVCEAASS